MSQAPTSPAPLTALTQPTTGSLSADYVEADAVARTDAKIAHLCGLFGLLGTGIFYLVKKDKAPAFVQDQMKEAFNFHLFVFVAAVVLTVAGGITGALLGMIAIVFSLASLALFVGAIILSIVNALKAGEGKVARYPARISVLK